MSDLSFDSATHIYRDGERQLTSVTTLLSEVGLFKKGPWLNDPKHRQKGTAVHHAVQHIDQGVYDPALYHQDIHQYAESFMRFKEKVPAFKGRIWECSMALPAHGVAGTFDVLAEVGDEMWLVDYKTGSVGKCSVATQLAAYEHLLSNGEVISRNAEIDVEWLAWAKTQKSRLRRRCLNLTAVKDQLSAFDEPKWPNIWRAALTIYGARKEYGLL